MVWTRLPSWISHSSLSMKQSRRHWVRGLREKNSKTIKFALGAAISDWCTLKLYFRHILILTEGNVGRYNKTIYSVSVSASLVPLWFSCWSFAWSWKSWECGHFQRISKGQSFVLPSKRRWERIGRQGLPANLSLISHFPAIPGILGLIFIKSMNCLNWKKTCSQISHNSLSPPHHLSIALLYNPYKLIVVNPQTTFTSLQKPPKTNINILISCYLTIVNPNPVLSQARVGEASSCQVGQGPETKSIFPYR